MSHFSQIDSWSISEIFLDLLQDKLLNFQQFFDISVLERDALQSRDVKELLSILQQKSDLQQKVNHLDKEMNQLQANNPDFIRAMNEEQHTEFEETIRVMVDLLQKIIDYEARNKEIALKVKANVQNDLNKVRTGNKLLRSYFNNTPTKSARFLDKTH